MRFHRHLLRDLVLLTLPVSGLVVYLWLVVLSSFWNAEIRNFHGELVRSPRIGTLRTMIQYATGSVFTVRERHFLPLKQEPAVAAAQPAAELEVFDLVIDGAELDALAADLPASAREKRRGLLTANGESLEVEANWRGQRMENYFFQRKSWKLRTKKRDFVDEQRVLNLTPLEDRLQSLVTFAAARAAGLAASETRLVHLYVNLEDQGVYLQEEQVDESMIRRIGRMPGDVFYGELFVPDVPQNSAWEVFWNPWLWEKQDRWNKYPEEWRPWLVDLCDAVCAPDPAALDRLDDLLDPSFALYFALLSFQGDQHVDHSHNHKLHFNLLTSRFEGLVWNPLLNMPDGQGVESTGNRLFARLAQDPRYLDRMAALVQERMLGGAEGLPALTQAQVVELDRVAGVLERAGLYDGWLPYAVRGMRRKLEERGRTVRGQHAQGDATWTQAEAGASARTVALFAQAVASLRLTAVALAAAPAGDIELHEDRDFDGKLSPGDRRLALRREGSRLVVTDAGALVYVGRDFTASYHDRPSEGQDTFAQHREFTRLAFLESRYLLVDPGGAAVPAVAQIELACTVGAGPVAVREGAPSGFLATETVHPWRIPPPPPARVVELAGDVALTGSLRLRPQDELRVAPGTVVRLGPGVSIELRSRVAWRDVRLIRLDPTRPFGVVALQGSGCDGSTFTGCEVRGGSEATLGHTYYSGMFSAHDVDGLTVRDCLFADNTIGDDGVRLGVCHDVLFERVRVENSIADAIDFDLCQGVIRDTVIVRPGNDGMDMMTGRVDLYGLEVTGAGDKGVSVGEGSHPRIEDCRFTECVTGIGIKDGSDPVITNCTIERCRTGVSSYDKNWRYPGGGRGRLVDCTLTGNDIDVKMDEDSELTLERCRTDRKFKLPDSFKSGGFVELEGPADPVRDAPGARQ